MKRITTLLFLFVFKSVFAQFSETDVTLTVQVSPPYSANIHDYSNFLNQSVMTIQNNTDQVLNIRFIMTLTNINTGMFFRSKSDLPFDPFVLQPLEFQSLTGTQGQSFASSNIDDYETNADDPTKQTIATEGILPEGNYQFCIQAFNYDVPGTAISQAFSGCTVVPITNLQPPIVIQPMCGGIVQELNPQQLIMNWMPVTGNVSGGTVKYHLYLVRVPDSQDPYDVMNSAVLSGAGVFIFQQDNLLDNHFIYDMGFQNLEGGVYAIQVKAYDPTGILSFANGGYGPVCSFTYQKNETTVVTSTPPVVVAPPSISCTSCTTTIPTDPIDLSHLSIGDKLKFGDQEVKVITLSIVDGKASGTGVFTFLNAPIKMKFSDVKTNGSNVVLSGQAEASKRPGISFLPTVSTPDLSPLPLSSDQITYIDKFATDNATHLLSNMMSSIDNSGFELPFGLDETVLGVNTVIAIVDIKLSPTAGIFNAGTVVDIPDAGLKMALSAQNICIKPNGICGDGILFLASDLDLPSLNMKLKGGANTSDLATYVQFKDFGFEKLRIKAEYALPLSFIAKKDNHNEKVLVTLIGEGKNWSDWTATVMFDPFVVKGVEDLSFTLEGYATYDHSSITNPIGIPADLVGDVTWNGFYLPALKVGLPTVIHKLNSSDPITFSATNLIIDGEGVSANLNGNGVLDLGDGSLDGWYFSINKIYATIIKNSFSEAGMDGSIILPICENSSQNQLEYHSTLSSSSTGKMGFQFVVHPKTNIDVKLWYAQFELFNTSNITVEYVNDSLKAAVDLSGKMDIVAEIKSIHVTYKLMHFEHLKLMSYAPFYSLAGFTGGFSSPQKDISGFDVTLDKFKLVSHDGLFGPSFEMGVKLSDLGALPNASVGFAILGRPKFSGGRPSWVFEDLDITKVSVKGDLGPAKVEGQIEFYKNDPDFNNGIRGELTMTVVGALSVKSQALFGHKNNYSYFYLDANVKLAVPVPISVLPAPPVSVFGMGAGLYYHLEPEKLSTNPDDLLHKPINGLANKYHTNPNTAGFLGNIVLGLSDGSTLQGICGLDATVNIGGGSFSLQNIRFDGKFYMLCPLGEYDKSVGQGVGVMNYDVANKVFDLQCAYDVYAKLGPLVIQKTTASLNFHIDGGTGAWHLKVGEPTKPISINPFNIFPPPYNALDHVITAQFYFMTGNAINSTLALNEDVKTAFGITNIPDAERGTPGQNLGKAIVFGAGLKLPYVDEKFLCFYLKFKGGMGFDFSLASDAPTCKGVDGLSGFNGYYANGQFYSYLEFDFGLDVDLWFYSGRVNAGSAHMHAAFLAGMPNPVWFEGWVDGDFDVLGGAVKGKMNFHLKVGEKCIAEKNFFGNGLPIISDIKPGTINSEAIKDEVEVDQIIEAGFNYPIGQEFSITDKDGDGKPTNRTFRIEFDYFNIIDLSTNAVVLSTSNNRMITWDSEHKSMMLYPKKSYTPHANHKIEIQVKVLELNKLNWKFEQATFKGHPIIESANAFFKAGGCPKSLKGKVLSSYPFPSQRFLLQEENNRKGHLDLPIDYDCMNDDKYELKVKFISYKDETELETKEVNAVMSGYSLNFDIPVLPNEALVHVIVYKKLKLQANSKYDNMTISNDFLQFANIQMLSTINPESASSSNIYMIKTSVQGNKHTSTDIQIYDYFFQTSQFNNLTQKLQGLTDNAKNYMLYYPYTELQTMEMSYGSKEGFDIYDLNGQTYVLGDAQFCNPANIDIREADVNDGWRGEIVKPYFSNYFLLANSVSPSIGLGPFTHKTDFVNLNNFDNKQFFGTNVSNSFLNPVGLSYRVPPMPYLSAEEIHNMMPHITIPEGAIMGMPFNLPGH